jgi:hypothetical protein
MAIISETETHAHWDYERQVLRIWSNRTNTIERILKRLEGCEGVIQDDKNSLTIPFKYVRKPDLIFRVPKVRTPEQMERDRQNGLRLKGMRSVPTVLSDEADEIDDEDDL